MPSLWYHVPFVATRFPRHIPRQGTLTITAGELAHALFTTGRAPSDQYAFGAASFYEMLHRTSLIPAYLRRTQDGRIVRSRLAMSLDRSEKVALSYALGQAFTAIFAHRVVNVPVLLHLDRYAAFHNVQFEKTLRRPDLIGLQLATGNWVVAEAKGRSGTVPAKLLDSLSGQKRAIRTIAGRRPALAFGCAASFPNNRRDLRRLRVDAIDPEEDHPHAVHLPGVDRDDYLQAYYEPFVVLLDQGEVREEGPYEVVDLGSPGLTVGLLHRIAEAVRRARENSSEDLFVTVKGILAQGDQSTRESGGFSDGSVVRTRWELPPADDE